MRMTTTILKGEFFEIREGEKKKKKKKERRRYDDPTTTLCD